jgi:hypothetical protein
MAKRVVGSVELERAETLVKVLFEQPGAPWPHAALEHTGIDSLAFSNYINHTIGTIRKLYPDIDPRHESAIATMMTHVFFVGCATGRIEGYSTDSGLNA